jgi:hypothetical protein
LFLKLGPMARPALIVTRALEHYRTLSRWNMAQAARQRAKLLLVDLVYLSGCCDHR